MGIRARQPSEKLIGVALTEINLSMREVLRWFGKWPEFVPSPDHMVDAAAALDELEKQVMNVIRLRSLLIPKRTKPGRRAAAVNQRRSR